MMFTEAPSAVFHWEDGEIHPSTGRPVRHAIEMRGVFRWELEFLALTGDSFQRACEDMGEQFAEFERVEEAKKAIAQAEAAYNLEPSEETSIALAKALEQDTETKILDPRWFQLSFDLFFASCAQWRAESGWDRKYARQGDESREPRQRGPYLTFVDKLRRGDFVQAQALVFRLLYLYNHDPGAAAGRKRSESQRPADDAPTSTTD